MANNSALTRFWMEESFSWEARRRPKIRRRLLWSCDLAPGHPPRPGARHESLLSRLCDGKNI